MEAALCPCRYANDASTTFMSSKTVFVKGTGMPFASPYLTISPLIDPISVLRFFMTSCAMDG